MAAQNPKVGPKLKISVPNFKRTDFSGDIEKLGGLHPGSSRKVRAYPRNEPSVSVGKHKASDTLGTPRQGYPDDFAAGSGALFDAWLRSLAPGNDQSGNQGDATDGSEFIPRDDDDGDATAGVPLETFDSPMDFEWHSPEEWLQICKKAVDGKPQAAVLHYISHEWRMLPCWVHGYEPQGQRYLVELEDGSCKQVKRLALRFNEEDPENFALRVETCRAKKAHCELQQAFIKFIESQTLDLVSPMLREQKERFIRQGLNKSHVEDARSYISDIRDLITEIEQNYVLSMKFAKVKGCLIDGMGTPLATARQDSPFTPLLISFLPKPVPYYGLVEHEVAEQPVMEIVAQLVKQPTVSRNVNAVAMAVWRRFGEEIVRHRILDTTRCGRAGDRNNQASVPKMPGVTEEVDRCFAPADFIEHMDNHRKDVTVILERHWRDYIVSEVLDKMSEGSNFFIENPQKHMRQPLHRVLRKLDLILSAQMRWFVQSSIADWVDFVRTFTPSPSQSLPPPLLTLNLEAMDGEVVITPFPEELTQKILELIDDITKVTSAISCIEYELVPFCNLPQHLMFELHVDPVAEEEPTHHFGPVSEAQLLREAKAATEEVIEHCLKGPEEVQALYQKYAHLMNEEVGDLDVLDVEGVRARTASYMQAGTEIEKLTTEIMKFPLFELHCHEIISSLSERAYALAGNCLQGVSHSIEERSQAVLNEWLDTHNRILSNPEDEEELANLKQFMNDLPQLKTKPLMETTRHIHTQINMLSDFSCDVESEVVERAFSSFAWPLQIQIDVGDSERSLDSQKQKFMDKLDQEKTEYERDMARYQEDLEWVKTLSDYSLAMKVSHRIYALKENLDRAKERVQSYVDRERLFGMDVSDYSAVENMTEAFEPYFKLWTSAIEFKHSEEEWLNGPLARLNAEEIETVVEEQFKESFKTIKQFDGLENPLAVAKDLREEISSFRANMPVIRALCQEAFQPMHYAALFDELDTDMDMEEGLTLQQMLEIGILERIDVVERISAEAQKQHSLKTALAAMKREWRPIEFGLMAHKSGTHMVKGLDEVQAVLDDHIVKTMSIRGSPFVKPIEKEVKDWEQKLTYIQDLLEQWLAVQRSWLYLEPIFGSDDIQRQMPNEAKRFQQVDTLWRATMEAVAENPNVLDVSEIENLLASFTDANKKLDAIQKGLNDYLETKRAQFPRFFFLSNDELLMILSQTKDPTAVQPHMGKCFEGISKVRFSENNDVIEAMLSVEGEQVELALPVNVVEGDKKGNVEKWLMEVQSSMIDCLTKVTASSLVAYAQTERTKWVLEWPGQVVICIDNIYWTQEVATSIQKGALDVYYKQSVQQLSGLVNLVRGNLSKLGRQTLSALVTIDVHNRDVVLSLTQAKISSTKDFDWIAQLRYYWRKAGSITLKETGKPNQVDKCEVSIINATLYYGFEYLGNSDRLVITPLTDRCYRTLMGAFHLYYGGGPEGPAGTGKTESTKDLAKAVAVQCVVFNCSDGLDYIAMGKFFKGIASSGAWCCFDEFNRINLEVLSVVSQQVQTIQFAIRDKKTEFFFEDTEIRLVPSCAVNITMNPGYAGRSELPDNLKALFRPCAMMVPDYALIGEIVLYSYGFEDAKNLARKAVGSLRLGSEQLSSQEHYDFGMRALKSILVRAGALRRMYGSSREESVLALSALNDVNLPKFTRNDIPLFLGITGDLFPGVQMPPSDYGILINELEGSARNLFLQPTQGFIHKCIQLWETIMVRHGLMLVGQTVSGKTEVENVLAAALAAVADGENYLPVSIHKINPKSIKQGQLYGDFDENTHEWTDGILALTVRFASSADLSRRQWILLDGPVDAVWIENMNTVLDDNKKLCLNSGEIIKLTPVTTMMFEVEDLAVASPATVSRCGMVFLEQADIGWRVLMLSWCERLPERLQEQSPLLQEIIEMSVDASWEMISRKVNKPVVVSLNWLVLNMLHLFWALIQAEIPLDPAVKDLSLKEKESKLEALFWLSLVWSFGCVTDKDGRKILEPFFRKVSSGQTQGLKDEFGLLCKEPTPRTAAQTRGGPPPFPDAGSVFDYWPSGPANKWEDWTKKITNFEIAKDAQVHSLIIPTADTARNAFLLQTLVKAEYHVLFVGPTGTGKTVVIQKELLSGFDKEKYNTIAFAFSAQSSANQTQDVIDGKLDKRKKGCYGPPFGKRCLVFVDDLNMPAKETYGAQPPIELLRQWMDTGGWYERKTSEFRQLVDLTFIGAMGPPGAGRPHITNRYQRHFNMIFVLTFEGDSLQRIFSSIMTWFLSKFSSQVSGLGAACIKATVDVYNAISENMLPTPAKSHYTFNLRDLAKVNQGICLCTKNSLPAAEDLIKCWAHECQRVFKDRLINVSDHAWFDSQLKTTMEEHLKKKWDVVVKKEPLIFCDFADSKANYYKEVPDHLHLQEVLKNCLMDYNSQAKRSMELVLFLTAVQHVCRIVRVLKTPLGNALLVGVGGSGRKSVATLATSVAEYDQFSIEITKGYGVSDWHEDVKRLLMDVGGKGKEISFLLTDTQIPKESFLEDASSLLNNGEVPNLFNAEDKTQILEVCTAPAAAAGRTGQAEVFAYFVEQCRRNMHLVLALSPIGEAFRRRVRMFPAIVNCCTIDWFMEWPDDALRGVANHFLQKVDLAEDVFTGVVEICVQMQKSVFQLVEKYFREVQRYYYVTPTSYLELINAFKDVLTSKRGEVSGAKRRYDDGLEKVISTEEQVKTMSVQLEELRPVLKQTSAETAELMTVIEHKQEEAAATEAVVAKEEASASQQAEASRAMKEECQADLDKALPALNAALDALKSLKKGDIVEVKNMKTPPDGVVMVSKALCWMFDVKPKKITADDGRTKIDDYWDPSKKSLWGDPRMLDRLMGYDKDNISVEVIEKLKPLEDDPEFEPEVIKKASVAAFGICKWVRAMIVYDGVAKVVGPKKQALAEAEAELDKVMTILATKKAELKAVKDNVAKLLSDFETAKKKKDDLATQVDDCSKRLVRAEKLISGLGGEKTRWIESSKKLGEQYTNLTGDVLIASGIIAYLGTFTGRYRADTVTSWVQLMRDNNLPSADEFSLRATLGNEVQIRQWVIDKLPNDQVSVENAIIIERSRRWPLMIDPQLQANQWVRKACAGRNETLTVLRLSQNYARTLEGSISHGRPVLLENVGEVLDPLLEPLLLKATFKAGNVIMIRLGDSTTEYNKDFRLFITTKLPNPHYSPEVCVQVTLLNFMATPDGLEDQMLGILVAREEAEVERKRQNLIVESAQSKAQLQEIEDRILQLLSESTGNILDDEELINTLANSKTASMRIEERVVEQEKTQAQVQETRATYVPVAIRASALFFVVADLCNVEPMYQYSLEWFYNIYELAIATAEKFERNIQKRLAALQSQFLWLLFETTCDSLFEKDKLMFSLLLSFKSMEVDAELNQEEKRLLLLALGGGSGETPKPEGADWLTDKMWSRICVLDKLGKGPWQRFASSFKDNIAKWKAVFDSDNPAAESWPGKETMTPLQRSLVLLAVRTDCTITGLQEVISAKLGHQFLEPPSFNLEKSYSASSACTPLIFVLSSGADPMAEVMRLAAKMGMIDRYSTVSLGQGQGPKAGRAITDGIEGGLWVILQNCHLAPSWMPTLEVRVEELNPEKVHDQFRLWLTAMPSPAFPVSVLQNGMKMTNEPPKGLKSNLLRAFTSIDTDWFGDACAKSLECKQTFRKMLFGLCFFHALIQERCSYGPLGWNIPYQFSEPDRQICMMQLRMFLEENDTVPYDALRYTAAQANYGGRVTDVHDRRCIDFLLADLYCPDILKDDYKFSPSGVYYAPAYSATVDPYIEYIRGLPINQMPEAFGLHANANLVAAISEVMRLLDTAASLQPKTGGGGGGVSEDDILLETATKFLDDIAPPFDTEAANHKYPVDYNESMNTVLNQELLRFNKLIAKVRSTLVDVRKAVKGLVVMSPELEEVSNGILNDKTPSVWKGVSYPSLKPITSYVHDLVARIKFLQTWIDEGIPNSFWLSGFYFTQSFLTGQLQNYARKLKLPIDTLLWNYKVLPKAAAIEKPSSGCLAYGLFLDGARWDDRESVIAESLPKVLFSELPMIHMVPCEASKDATDKKSVYPSPVYKTSERKGTLSTTGHSTNFVMTLLLPMAKQHTEKYWAKRGLACLTQLDD
eukprot:TRINITY_DN20021_c0_g4_i1.p1 TRINITY_DN20021_c0_g4~~TRINITY_DN20021_c0_g4_i1.p1  ORF type:complete len:4150 (-),score=1074.99 TRINITY_DN20021_c0_g4_i1:152-12580(-)